jgi:hypothetical protein
VVLHVANHPLLTGTGVFKEQVTRELRDGLQAAFGNMGTVEVVDKHDLLEAIVKQGLGQPLDGLRDVSDTKTHFVLIDFVNGRYEIQARQHDGLTGLVSPVIRHAATTDRQFVARTAALLIDRDLGVVGTLDTPKNDEVRVTFKGSGLGMPMSRWVQKDDLFAVVRVARVGDGLRADREPGTLLRVKDAPGADGVCTCRVYHRYRDPLRNPPYRCVKLGTTQARVRLWLVDEKGRKPLAQKPVAFSAFDFGPKGAGDEVLSTDQDGFVESQKAYKDVAFVRVGSREQPLAYIPTAIIGDRLVTYEINSDPKADELAQFKAHRRQWENQMSDSADVANALIRKIRGLAVQNGYDAALKESKDARDKLQDDIKDRTQELRRLRDEARELGSGDGGLSEAGLKGLEEQVKNLDRFINELQKALAKQSDPGRKPLLANLSSAQLSEANADYDEALALYHKVIKEAEALDEPKLRAEAERRLDALKKALKPKNEAHEEAQEFFKSDWPKRETMEQLRSGMETARKMFEVCKKNEDRLTPKRLLKANVAHTNRLNKRLEKLRPRDDPDDQKEAEATLKVVEELTQLTKDVLAYVEPAKADKEDE